MPDKIAIQEEGLYTTNNLASFREDGIKMLCSSLRKPGGLIVDPKDNGRAITNQSHSIHTILKLWLKRVAYEANLYNPLAGPSQTRP